MVFTLFLFALARSASAVTTMLPTFTSVCGPSNVVPVNIDSFSNSWNKSLNAIFFGELNNNLHYQIQWNANQFTNRLQLFFTHVQFEQDHDFLAFSNVPSSAPVHDILSPL